MLGWLLGLAFQSKGQEPKEKKQRPEKVEEEVEEAQDRGRLWMPIDGGWVEMEVAESHRTEPE